MESSTERLKKPTTAGPDRVALVRELGAIASKAKGELTGLDLGPRQALLGPLSTARTKFKRQLDKVRTSMTQVDDASKGIGEMAQGPSKYLVLAANNSEMRAGSGMLLSAGVLTMQDGQFNLGPMTDTGFLKVPAGAVPISGDLAARWGWTDPSQEWRNLAMSPNFPANARLAAQMWKAKTGESVDGVIAIDPIGLKSLLEVSGPEYSDLDYRERGHVAALARPLRAANEAGSPAGPRCGLGREADRAEDPASGADEPQRAADYDAYREREGQALTDWATWCVLAELYGPDWRAWPAALARPASEAVAMERGRLAREADFHAWLQWLADGQLAAAQDAARAAGMDIGIIQDLAVGAHPGGADAWSDQDLSSRGSPSARRPTSSTSSARTGGRSHGIPSGWPHSGISRSPT